MLSAPYLAVDTASWTVRLLVIAKRKWPCCAGKSRYRDKASKVAHLIRLATLPRLYLRCNYSAPSGRRLLVWSYENNENVC